MDDLELLNRYVSNGDKDAVSSLIHKYQNMVFSACMKRLGCAADAEDASQQVFMAMMQSGGNIRTSVKQWLYRCAINVSASIIRTRCSRAHHEQEKSRQNKGWCGNGEAEQKETYSILRQCLSELDETDQQVLVDNQVNDVTQQALASSMGVTQQAVAKRIGKILVHLRRELTSRGVIFSLLATVLLAVKRAASAAVPQSLKAAPSATLASGGAAGAGTAGMLKAGAAAMLIMAAAVTYKCAEDSRPATSDQPSKTVSAARERPAAGNGEAGSVSFKGRLPTATPISLVSGSPGRPVQQARLSGAAVPSEQRTTRQAASSSLYDAPGIRNQQETPADAQNNPAQTASYQLSYALHKASDDRPDRPAEKNKAIDSPSDAPAVELAVAADKLPAPDATSAENYIQHAGPQTAMLEAGEIKPANLRVQNTAQVRPDTRLKNQINLSTFARPVAPSDNHLKTDYPTADNFDEITRNPVDIGPQEIGVQEWKIPQASAPSTPNDLITAAHGTITVAAGDMLTAAGRLDGRLINQGTVQAKDDSPLYLDGLVSGRGSYTGSVVFTNGFSPGNSPAAVHLDSAVLDPGNILTMELAGLTPGSQHDQLIIDNHLTLGGQLNVELIYGFIPQFGNSFTLFDGDFSGEFSDIILPTLGGGLRWDTSMLYTGGSLQVVQMVQAVPEPATVVLLAGGLVLLKRRRRRS